MFFRCHFGSPGCVPHIILGLPHAEGRHVLRKPPPLLGIGRPALECRLQKAKEKMLCLTNVLTRSWDVLGCLTTIPTLFNMQETTNVLEMHDVKKTSHCKNVCVYIYTAILCILIVCIAHIPSCFTIIIPLFHILLWQCITINPLLPIIIVYSQLFWMIIHCYWLSITKSLPSIIIHQYLSTIIHCCSLSIVIHHCLAMIVHYSHWSSMNYPLLSIIVIDHPLLIHNLSLILNEISIILNDIAVILNEISMIINDLSRIYQCIIHDLQYPWFMGKSPLSVGLLTSQTQQLPGVRLDLRLRLHGIHFETMGLFFVIKPWFNINHEINHNYGILLWGIYIYIYEIS